MKAAAIAVLALTACGFDGLPPLIDAADPDASEVDATEADSRDPDASEVDATEADSRDPDASELDAAVDAAPDAPIDAPSCLGQVRCTGDLAQQCNALGQWVDLAACTNFCGTGGCVNPPSCSSIGNCAGGSCCAARYVPAGFYYRSYDGVTYLDMTHPATISPFVLDRFEVSVNRFRRFVAAYPGSLPSPGTGKNPHVAGDLGWDATWNATMPATKAALETALSACAGATYMTTTGANDDRPVNCVTWYLAQAFCVWDGGRLPTEAEWNLAAAGGDEQRVYPWSAPPTSSTIDTTRATYGTTTAAPVGSRPAGAGRWGQADLAGNVSEWLLDWYRSPYATSSCADCQDLTTATARVVRGGHYNSSGGAVVTSLRSSTTPTTAAATTGLRCVHDR